MAISDIYDSLTSERPYKDAMDHEEAVSIIYKETGTHFDPLLIELLRDTIPSFDGIAKSQRQYPAGNLSSTRRGE